MKTHNIALIVIALALLPFAANAHVIAEDSGFIAGFWHPVLGLDHFLAMLSVGILSTQIGGRAIWTVPAAFVTMMTVGGVIGFQQIDILFSEYILSFSVFALGFAIAAARKMPALLAMVFVGMFGIFHGYAHGLEMPAVAKAFPYASGFVLATASIHIAGVFIGLGAKKLKDGTTLLRYAGAIIAGMGLELTILMKDLC